MNSSISPGYFALIPAAGIGARMVAQCPKQYLRIAGKSILQHSVNAFLEHKQINHVYVVVSQDDAYVAQELKGDPRLTVLFCGGDSRTDSVTNGLSAMRTALNPLDWVLVHDAARPGLNQTLISRLIDAVGLDDAGGLLALPVADTVKLHVINSGKSSVSTVPRAGLWLAQTPQMFKHGQLLAALTQAKNANMEITDEASAMEISGIMPKLVEGHWCNTKITRPDDFALIEAYLTNLPHNKTK